MKITEKASAKINLGLDTPFLHKDGVPEWNMMMTSIDLSDRVEIETLPNGDQINVHSDSGFLPEDRRNLAFQAAMLMKKRFRLPGSFSIRIHKQIPVAAGLGGGSSDAAAVMRGLNQLFELGLSKATLAQLALRLDSDVPYCIYSQTAQVSGRGEKVLLMPKLPSMWLIIVKPRLSVSTPKIISQINYNLLEHPNIEALVENSKRRNFSGIVEHMGNVLETISGQRYPEIMQLKAQMLNFGADGSQMSGTGPTVFGICQKYSRAKRIFNSLQGFCNEVYLVRPL